MAGGMPGHCSQGDLILHASEQQMRLTEALFTHYDGVAASNSIPSEATCFMGSLTAITAQGLVAEPHLDSKTSPIGP